MPSVISAGTSTNSALNMSADTSGVLALATNNGTTAVTITTGQQVQVNTGGSASAPVISKSDDTNTGIFFPAADTIAFAEGGVESVRIDASGNMGIGTNNPTSKLEVAGQMSAAPIYIKSGGATSTLFYDSALLLTQSGTGERMRINSSGNVGIGLADPSFRLDVARGSSGVVLNLQGTDAYNAETGITFSTQRAKISGFLEGSGGTPGTSLRFFTMPNDGSVTERMRIAADGAVRIACESFASNPGSSNFGISLFNTSQGARFYGQGTGTETQIEFGNRNGQRGSIQTTSGGTSYNTTSDYRLKENITPMTGALATVTQLKPCTYTWKVDGSDGQGFIAHELAEVVPDCVTGEKDALDDEGNIKPQCVDTSFLVATLTAAIQELKQIVDTQATEIAALKAKVGA
jgi:hypothetical protein